MSEPTRIAPPAGPPDPPPPADLTAPAYITSLQGRFPGAIQKLSYWVGDWTVVLDAARLVEVGMFLRDDPEARFNFCSDVTASDWPPRAKRFDVIYSLYSVPHRHRLRLKVQAADGEAVPTVSGVWPAANWLEREVFDMFGIEFAGHPDMRRILLPEDWEGFPLRKDKPITAMDNRWVEEHLGIESGQ